MPPEAARVRRLQRLEKIRAIAKQSAAATAAEAESTLSQLEALAARTRAMANDYGTRTASKDGHDLHQLGWFIAGLRGISAATRGDAEQARIMADRKQHELALAERRRAAVEDRVKAGERDLAQRVQSPVLGARRAVGTDLE